VDLAKLKQAENEVIKVVDAWPKWTQAVAYRYLNGLGIRLDDVDRIIREGLKSD